MSLRKLLWRIFLAVLAILGLLALAVAGIVLYDSLFSAAGMQAAAQFRVGGCKAELVIGNDME